MRNPRPGSPRPKRRRGLDSLHGSGFPRVSVIDTDRFRETLLEERRRVQAALQNLHDETSGNLYEDAGEETAYDNHLADTATETYDRELDYTLEENSEHVLAEIDAALVRIDDGTYGTCTNCQKQIPEERLEALPWATLCIDCQRDRERR
jgi:DnaK suppressor protein